MERDDAFGGLSKEYGRNSRIMLSAVICLFFVVLLVLILHLYARCILRRRARDRAITRHLVFAVASAEGEALNEQKRGLDPSILAALPLFLFKKDGQGEESVVDCAVCLCSLKENESARLLPNCNHTFHTECIDMWLHYHSTCPICRTAVEPRKLDPPASSTTSTVAEPTADSVNLTTTEDLGTTTERRSKESSSSSSRLSSFRRMLSRDWSNRRSLEDISLDLERQ